MRVPNNKALAVLALLREEGEMTCQQIADTIRERTPCGTCNGTGKGDDSRYGCRKCYGRGQVMFHYSEAYQALKQLHRHRLVTRRYLHDEWGDATRTLVWGAVANETTDELEALYNAPAAEKP